jgi:PAS domain S-box-containing protein
MSAGQIKLLLVEDEPGDVRSIRKMLGEATGVFFDIECVDRLSTALRRLARDGIDAVLLDLGLPDSSGLETLNRVRARAPEAAIVIITGLDDESIAIESLQQGAQDYLVKGQIDGKLLSRSLRYALERRSTEQTLRQAESRYKTLFDSAPDAIIVVGHDGRIVSLNAAASQVFGYEPRDMLGRPFQELPVLKPEVMPRALEYFQSLVLGHKVEDFEMQITHKDGTYRWTSIRAATITSDQGQIDIAVVARDITARKEMEKELSSSEERLRDLMEEAPIILCNTDLRGTFTYVNKRCEEASGYSRGEFLGKNALEMGFFSEDSVRLLTERLRERLEGGPARVSRIEFKHRDGKLVCVEAEARVIKESGRPVGFQICSRDVTELKQAEDALRESEKRYRAIFDNPLNMVFINDGHGVFLDANETALQRLGYTRDAMGNAKLQDVVHPDDLPRAVQSVAEAMKKGYMEKPVELRVFTKSGEWIWLEVYGYKLGGEGESYRGLGLARDINERKRAEEALRNAEEKLKETVEKLQLSQAALSTPVVQLWDGVLALPLIGMVDDRRAQQVMEVLLRKIVETQSELVILDVTGVASIDTQVANHLIQTTRSVSLLGARCALTGIKPEVAQTVIELGLDMGRVVVKRDMQDGLKWALGNLDRGVRDAHLVVR